MQLGAKIIGTSKWLNALVVSLPSADTILLNAINRLSFVKSIELTYKGISTRSASIKNKLVASDRSTNTDQNYNTQITMHQGDFLHNKNFTGQGMLIALLDGGYSAVDSIAAFNSVKNDNRLVARRSFITCGNTCNIIENHGTKVFSVLTGSAAHGFTGSAPDASYILCRTEDPTSEYPVEADYWIIGVEYADSLGADIINTSLGYGYFNDATFDYPKHLFDGHSLRISKAANIAAAKGMLMVTSAGNEGGRQWQKLLAPADADSVMAVGSINADGAHSSFSSYGPINGDIVKPNVVAIGNRTTIINDNGSIGTANGTSFSTPVISGLAACLWQAYPHLKAWEIKSLIETSSHQYLSPDTILGYGIPNFKNAYNAAQESTVITTQINNIKVYPNPTTDAIKIATNTPLLEANLHRLTGELALTQLLNENSHTNTISVAHLPTGIYILRLRTKDGHYSHKIAIE